MTPLPHHYAVTASAVDSGVTLSSPNLPSIDSEPPLEFGGPGNRWSPETLLVAAVVDCFVLSFKIVAAASKLSWTSLECAGNGTVDRQDGALRFTGITLQATLTVPASTDPARAQRLLQKAEQNCLVSRSLRFEPQLQMDVRQDGRQTG